MVKRLSRILLVLLLLFSLNPSLVNATEEPVTITIFHTNDLHGRVEEGAYDGIGYAKLATLINEVPDSLLFDAGDTFHGKTIASLVEGESVAEIMNLMHYDAMCPGNHDFNYSYERLLELDEITDFPILCANVKKDDEYILTPYTIIEAKGKRLGVFGLATEETLWKSHPDNTKGLTFIDSATAAREVVDTLQAADVDMIIALAHLGQDADSTQTSLYVAEQVPEIDLIIDGHSHTKSADVVSTANTVIVSAGEYGQELGKVTVTFADELTIEASAILKEETGEVEENSEIMDFVASIKDEQEVILNEVVGETLVDLQGEREFVRAGETNLGNLITDAMRYVSRAEIALTNGGGIRASIPAGEITKGDVITVLPFGNYVQVKSIQGKDILAALEHGASSWPETKGAFPHVSGLTYEIDGSKTENRIFNVVVNAEPLQLERYYTLATNDFMAAGGDGYTMFADAEHLGDYSGLDEVVITYLQDKQVVAPQIENRIIGHTSSDTVQEQPSEASNKIYVVQPGDVLWKIAEQYQSTWEVLSELNNLANPHLILPGMELIVP